VACERLGEHSSARDLEPPPRRPVEQLAVVRSTDDDDVRRKTVDLEQQRGNHALDLAGLMLIRLLFGDRVEFVEEQDATASAGELERVVQTRRCLAEEARHHSLVPDDVERQHEFGRYRFRDACLAVPRRARQQEPVPGFNTITAQQLGTLLFFDQLRDNPSSDRLKLKFIEATAWYDLLDEVANSRCAIITGETLAGCRDDLGETVGKQVMLVGTLLSDHSLNEYAEPLPIAPSLRLYKIKKQVCAGHVLPPLLDHHRFLIVSIVALSEPPRVPMASRVSRQRCWSCCSTCGSIALNAATRVSKLVRRRNCPGFHG
jgi:hypothetical protein